MRALTLEDIKPEAAKFTLQLVPDREFEIRPISVLDRRWLKNTFNADQIKSIFMEYDFEQIARIVYHQLTLDDQMFLKKQSVKIVNEDGDEKEIVLGGVNLFLSLVTGLAEQRTIIEAMTQTFGISKSLMDEAIADDEKKSQLIGQESATPSEASTDGQPTTSLG
jgi:hypothetical protein